MKTNGRGDALRWSAGKPTVNAPVQMLMRFLWDVYHVSVWEGGAAPGSGLCSQTHQSGSEFRVSVHMDAPFLIIESEQNITVFVVVCLCTLFRSWLTILRSKWALFWVMAAVFVAASVYHMTQVEAGAEQDLVGANLCLEKSVLVRRMTLCSCLFWGLWQQQVKAHLWKNNNPIFCPPPLLTHTPCYPVPVLKPPEVCLCVQAHSGPGQPETHLEHTT